MVGRGDGRPQARGQPEPPCIRWLVPRDGREEAKIRPEKQEGKGERARKRPARGRGSNISGKGKDPQEDFWAG